jgi:uncharacterized repeat protein (TIGR03803 family)
LLPAATLCGKFTQTYKIAAGRSAESKNQAMKLPMKPSLLGCALIAASSLILPYQALTQTFTTLHAFSALSNDTNADGAYGYDTLVVSGNTLYGTADGGGGSSNGTVFAMNIDGTGYTVLHTFSQYNPSNPDFASYINADGAHPFAGVILSGDTLYGTAISGGSTGSGTVFALNTNGTSFRTVYSFTNGSDGSGPYGGLTLSLWHCVLRQHHWYWVYDSLYVYEWH